MVNFFDSYVPTVYGSGSWGTIDGDGPSADRYTECHLSEFSIDNYIRDLKTTPNIVDWIDTFDKSSKEPVCLPSKFPMLLVNGNYGIGVGLISSISKHNMMLVGEATLRLIDDPESKVCIPPDQCLNCEIINTDWKTIANTGHGNYIVRGKMNIIKSLPYEATKNKKYTGLPALEIVSTPDMVSLNKINEDINDMVEKKMLPQVVDLLSDNRKGETEMSSLIILKEGSDYNYVKDMIYKHTELQHTVTENFVVLYKYNMEIWSQRGFLLKWIENDRLKITRKYYNMIQQLVSSLSTRDAYIKCIQSKDIDKIIDMIRKKKNINDRADIEWLIKNIHLTEAQAIFILEQKVKKLSLGYLEAYKKEVKELISKIAECKEVITNPAVLDMKMKEEILFIMNKYGTPPHCDYINVSALSNIPEGEFKLAITEKNFIKKVPANEPIGNVKNDRIIQVLKADNTKSIIIFDTAGKVYKLPVHKIPISDKGSNGADIRLIIKKLTANICQIMYEPLLVSLTDMKIKQFIVVQSKLGNIKKLDIEDIITANMSGLIYAKLQPDDYINDVIICSDGCDVISYSDNKALRFNIGDIPHLARNTIGNMSMRTEHIDGLMALSPSMTNIIVITEKGYINKFAASGLQNDRRGKSGTKVIKLSKGDKIKYIYGVDNKCILDVITTNGKENIKVSDIKDLSSVASGTKMIKGEILQVNVFK